MGRPRYAKKDANQSEIVADLEKLGLLVFDVSHLAHLGCDLIVVGFHRRWLRPIPLLVEVKSSKDAELTKREAEVQAEMQYRFKDEAPYIVAYSAEDVARWYKMM